MPPADSLDTCFDAPFTYLKGLDYTFFGKRAPAITTNLTTATVDRALSGPLRDITPLRLVPEDEFENWTEAFAMIARRARWADDLIMVLLHAKVSQEVACVLETWDVPELTMKSPELYMELLGSVLYPASQLHLQVAVAIWNASPAPNTVTALSQYSAPLHRYLRLCKRHSKKIAMTDMSCYFFLLTILPRPVASHLMLHFPDLPLEEMITKVRAVGSQLDLTASTTSATTGFLSRPADLDLSLDQIKEKNPSVFKVSPNAVPISERYDRCHGCLGDHRRRTCPFSGWRCLKCHELGHLARACQKLVQKDRSGRIISSVQSGGGRTSLTVHQDNSQADRLQTVANAMTDIKDRVVRDSQARRNRYHVKHPSTKPRLPVPAFAAAPYFDRSIDYFQPEGDDEMGLPGESTTSPVLYSKVTDQN